MNTLETLTNYGFEPSEAEIYQILIENGEMSVPEVLEKTELSRASIYGALTTLMAKDLLDYRKEGRSALYKPLHPNKLFGLIEQKKRETTLINQEMEETIKGLTGAFNLSLNKPGVRFIEGKKEVFWKILKETLDSPDPIYTISDEKELIAEQGSMDEYDEKRKQKKIVQYIILPNNSAGRRLKKRSLADSVTKIKIYPNEILPFRGTLDLFDGKIILSALRSENPIMMIVEDPDIYKMQRYLFEVWWKSLD